MNKHWIIAYVLAGLGQAHLVCDSYDQALVLAQKLLHMRGVSQLRIS